MTTDTVRRSGGDVVGTVLLLLLHAGLGFFGFLLSFGLAMGIDVCAYQDCGDEAWIGRALFLIWYVAGLGFLADVVVSVVFMARGRRVAVIPAIGCSVQFAIILAAFVMSDLAGPVG